ncbi:MAG: ABC transporter ATP-binding protein [Verrucomicrobiales bacterium]|nr:ABC transporter ATP-binding protein [Verrucomicrobiales bacterium]
MALLDIRDLSVDFTRDDGRVRAIDRVSLRVEANEVVGLVGESGSGKTVTALSIARLLPCPPARYAGGEIELDGEDVLKVGTKRLSQLRGGQISYMFQEPATSLNPVHRVGVQVREMLRRHRPALATDREVVDWLRRVGIPAPEKRARDFPHQLSGGMQQRVMIAMALASRPRLLVADEPTTALDVTIQAAILELLRELRAELGMSILLITHNLGLVAEIADRMIVMYAGQVVEEGPVDDVLDHPAHPYTRALLESMPRLEAPRDRLAAIEGSVPTPGHWPTGCRFAPRCALARAECRRAMPPLERMGKRTVRCPWAPPTGAKIREPA